MRILIVTDCYLPNSGACAKLIHELGLELRQQNNEVIILTPSETITENLFVKTEDGLQVARVKMGQLKGVSRPVRAWREMRMSATLWRRARALFKSQPCDLILYYSPSIFFGPLVQKLKALWRCPAYLILRDIFPQWAVDVGVLKKGLIWSYFRWMELQQYAAADVIGVQSPANLKYFAEQLPHKNYNLEVLYNWTTTNHPMPKPSTYRQQLALEDKVVFFYGGNIGVAQDMDNIVRLAERMREQSNVHFLLVGSGSEVERLQGVLVEKQLMNMTILPAVEQDEYCAMLAEFDVGLISLDQRLKTQNYPGKILGYMSASLPILGSINPGNDLSEMLEDHEAGLCSLNGDDDRLYAHALQLAQDASYRRRLGQNARRLLERYFSVAVCANQILARFQTAPVFAYQSSSEPRAVARPALRKTN